MEHLQKLICPEIALAALLSRPTLSTQQITQSRILIKQIDYSCFIELLNQHHIWTCVYCHIKNYFVTLFPENLVFSLEKKYKKNTSQSHQQFIAYAELLYLFKTANIIVRTIKGIPLARKLYGDISKRHSKDIDLIIQETQIDLAHEKLTSLGYQCDIYDHLQKHQLSLYFKAHKDLTYINRTGIVLELHIRLCSYENALTLHYSEQLFDNNLTDTFTNGELIYLCWHGSHTLFHRLKWLLDITLYLEQFQFTNEASFESLIKLAKQLDLLRALAISWVLANTIYGTPLPTQIHQFYKRDKVSQVLTKQALIALNHPKQVHSISFKCEKYFSEVLLPQYWANKWFALSQKLNPDIIDLLMLPALPAKLTFIHNLLRPLTLCYRLAVGKKHLPKFDRTIK